VLQAPMFGTRFRWNATRSLALLRFAGGRKVPPPLLRMRSEDLLAAVFPAQVGCQDNRGAGEYVEPPDHPLVHETMRDCLTELMDVPGLAAVLAGLLDRSVRFVACETTEPSVLAHELLAANPYAFLDDAPLEERRARAVSVRRGLPADMAMKDGALDPTAIATVVREATPAPRDADELHDLLLDQGALPAAEAEGAALEILIRDGRAARLVGGPSEPGLVVATERRSLAASIWPARAFVPDVKEPSPREWDRDLALAEVVRGRLAILGPVTAAEIGLGLGLGLGDSGDVEIALARLESEGGVMRGHFRASARGELEWCDRRLLARIHRLTVAGLRQAIEPVMASDMIRFLLRWQGLSGAQHRGREGVLRAVEQLQGYELAAGAWEREVLPARVPGYDPAWLDALCLSGEVVWGRLAPRETGSSPTRAARITLARRRDLPWLLAAHEDGGEDALSESARAVLAALRSMGASFFDELTAATSRGRSEVEDALWELCAAGRVTGDGFAGLRALIEKQDDTWRVGRFRGGATPAASGRWALVRAVGKPHEPDDAQALEAAARQYLRRYGVVLRDLVAREPHAPPWRDLVRVYRRMEMSGEIRGGRMVAAFVGEQFALPEALDALRAARKEPKTGAVVRVAACDPLNLVGVLTPGPRVPAHVGGFVEYRDGVPVAPAPVATNAAPQAAAVA
jgi:ATP-dependent Lhr-like helicase